MSFTVLKLGWEFPPNNHGGLGVACEGLVRGLTSHGIKVIMVLPRYHAASINNCQFIATNEYAEFKKINVDSFLIPYSTSESYDELRRRLQDQERCIYGEHIFAEVERYAQVVAAIAQSEHFDVIHAHDWMSIKAGVRAKQLSGKPLIFHVHATEFDRTGGNSVHQHVYDIERWGMEQADRVIAVSNYTKRKIAQHYSIPQEKIAVIHNAIADKEHQHGHDEFPIKKEGPIVLFLGRLTLQKGPDYFVTAAQKILEIRPDITFVIVGKGDMENELMERVAALGLSDKILFTGMLQRPDVNRAYAMADVFIMPSVSEPFGLTVLEAMQHGTPVILSKQSGVSEVVNHCLAVDFWDIHQMVDKVLAILEYQELKNEMGHNAQLESRKFCWREVAEKCIYLYKGVCEDA